MIPRYSPKEFVSLWSDQTRFDIWLEVELSACEAMESAELVPSGTAQSIRDMKLKLNADKISEIERETRHDVIAFLTHVEELAGPPARWLHRGMTSSDVLDTSFAIQLTRAADQLIERTDKLVKALELRAREHVRTPMIGRSHAIHAEPLTFGVVLAGHLAEIKRGRSRLIDARAEIAVGKIAGAVGTYAHLSPEIEAATLIKLGLTAETVSTQVVARDRHAAFFCAMGLLASGIERFSINVRHWQRNEVGEAEEKFSKGQKGSSAMPHKRNPILSENLCGLARVVRAAVTPAFENIALWHERDISHSSVERMMAPDATATLAFMLDRVTLVVEGLVVYPEKLKKNLDMSGGLYFSEAIMLALVGKGIARQAAYVLVQRNAMKAFHGEGEFRALLGDDAAIGEHLDAGELDRCFDLEHALRYADAIVDRACRE
ncbi:MAG: adenylosuccinate lyase [Polyangiaceae bacterium]|nr:adenylosuccinate lyase [Polyangiaceae bacterium]